MSAGDCTTESAATSDEAKSDAPKSVTEVFEEIKQKGASSSFINNHKTKKLAAVSFNQFKLLNNNIFCVS